MEFPLDLPVHLMEDPQVYLDLLVFQMEAPGPPSPPDGRPRGLTRLPGDGPLGLSGGFGPPGPPGFPGPPVLLFMQPNESALDQSIADISRSVMQLLATQHTGNA